MNTLFPRSLVFTLTASFSLFASAQDADFQLFEDVERPETNTPQEQRVRPNSQPRLGGGPVEPMFTLVGTTRIGDERSALLQHQSGEVIRVEIDAETNIRIPGHQNYSIVYFGPRRVSIRYPDSELCQEFEDKGVSCSLESNIAALSLVTREPLPPSRPVNQTGGAASESSPMPVEAEPGTPEAEQAASRQPINPFAALLNARNNADGDGGADTPPGNPNSQNTQLRRIDPADVPEGYRRISTPFGDRVVPQ